MESNNRTARVDPRLVPSPEDAVRQYEEAGGHLTHFSGFGEDPLANDTVLIHQRDAEFHQRFPNFDPFFTNWSTVMTLFFVMVSFFSFR